MTEPLNFHAIIGPNGMCMCGVEADGTVVTCGGLLAEYVTQQITGRKIKGWFRFVAP